MLQRSAFRVCQSAARRPRRLADQRVAAHVCKTIPCQCVFYHCTPTAGLHAVDIMPCCLHVQAPCIDIHAYAAAIEVLSEYVMLVERCYWSSSSSIRPLLVGGMCHAPVPCILTIPSRSYLLYNNFTSIQGRYKQRCTSCPQCFLLPQGSQPAARETV